MDLRGVAAALGRTARLLRRRPTAGLHDDAPATARWHGGTRICTRHADGHESWTDMPPGLGGSQGGPTPGWLLRAGVASCTATVIAMTAAMEGIELEALEVEVHSRSDTRGVLGLRGEDGEEGDAGPRDFRIHVRLSAHGTADAALQALVATACHRCPMANAIQSALPLPVSVEVVR